MIPCLYIGNKYFLGVGLELEHIDDVMESEITENGSNIIRSP